MVPLMVAVTSCAAPRTGHKQIAKKKMLSNRTVECFNVKSREFAFMRLPPRCRPETLASTMP
jgi:hypothetical protein